MNIYRRKNYWKFLLFLGASAIGLGSLWYTNKLVDDLGNEELKKMDILAKATTITANYDNRLDENPEILQFFTHLLHGNETIPVIRTTKSDSIIEQRNLDPQKADNPKYLQEELQEMKDRKQRIPITYMGEEQYIYYGRSLILEKLTYYPFIQLGVILLFILIAYFAFSSSRKAEQNQVWVGLSKETAHQLGTPISSLMAWSEIIKDEPVDKKLIKELGKDVNRLHTIAERFSKIGSKPALTSNDMVKTVNNTVNYLRSRTSDKIKFDIRTDAREINAFFNVPLFEWVLENVCKNAMDACDGEGMIALNVQKTEKHVIIDITDTGKGIPASRHKTIFKPGYTTKERGWGLGLSLTKRIVQEYHKGKISVLNSELGKGTTIRIMLKNISEDGIA